MRSAASSFGRRSGALKGAEEEDRARLHLEAQGLRLILRNYRVRGGELDLVMRDGDTVVVIEVRKRSNRRFGDAFESVGWRKRSRIMLAARYLLAAKPELARLPLRFDVVGIDGDGRIDWIRGAFDATE